jgi:NADP+-dependent farnesol dehydrogenase
MNYRALQREFVQEVSYKLRDLTGEFHPLQCDVTKEQDILAAFSWIKEHLGGVDVMINNAGVAHQSFLAGKLLIVC